MTEINGNLLQNIGLNANQQQAHQNEGDLAQEDFLQLMIAQFKNQDPMKPMQNGEFLGQMAQFGTVSGIQDLQKAFGDLSSSLVADQTLQASGLLDREVLVPSGTVNFSGETISGAIPLPEGVSQGTVEIHDAQGSLVATLPVSGDGMPTFQWDGTLPDGSPAPHGEYTVSANYGSGENSYAAEVMISGRVNSVVVNSGQALLDVSGLGNIRLNDVFRIK